MADELQISAGIVFEKGSFYVAFGKTGLTFDVTGSQYIQYTQSVGVSEELLVVGDIALGGYIFIYNSHATATVSYRAATGLQDTVDIGPGEIAVFRTHVGSTPYVISDTAGAEIEYVLLEA